MTGSYQSPEYPLVVTDDTIMSRDELLRYIRNKCGWEVADALEHEFRSLSEQFNVEDALRGIQDAQSSLEDVIDSLRSLSDQIEDAINPRAGRRSRP